MNNRNRQFSIILLTILATIGIVVDVAGLVFVWSVKQPLTNFAVQLLDVGQSAARAAEQVIDPLDLALDQLQQPVDRLASAAQELSQATTEPGLALRLLPEALSTQLEAALNQVQEVHSNLLESVLSLNETLEALNALPLVSVPTLADTDLPARYTSLQAQVQRLRTLASDARTGVAERFDTLSEQAASTAETIQSWQQVLNQIRVRLENIQDRLSSLAEGLPLWIELASWTLTVLLLAGLASQSVVLILARSLYKNARLHLQPGWLLGEESRS